MAKSTLQAFVNATRQMLTLQLLVGVAAVGLAGWTATVTTQLVRERNALSARVLQLEETIDKMGGETPPPLMTGQVDATPTPTLEAPPMQAEPATPATEPTRTPNTPTETTTPPSRTPTTTTTTTTTATTFDPGRFIHDAIQPPPALSTVVLHVRAAADRARAERIARELGARGMQVSIDVLPAGDQRASGYAYFDIRQARPAAALASQLQQAARSAEIEPWVATLNGVALTASAEYAANRVDFVLPALPAPPRTGATETAPSRTRIDALRAREMTTRPATTTTAPPPR